MWEGDLFGWHSIGLAIGFFAYMTTAVVLDGRQVIALGRASRRDTDQVPLPDEIP